MANLAINPLQLVTDVAIWRQRQALCQHHWTADITAQPFQLSAFLNPGCYSGIQTDPGLLAYPISKWLITGEQGL
jgi:hypothetical protein